MKFTLPTDSARRKDVQLVAAFLNYLPAAAVRFALHSKAGNDKHNPGEAIHHARGKSSDHAECIMRHLMDMQDIEARMRRVEDGTSAQLLLDEATALFWRAGIQLQELCERYEGAPLAPGARLPEATPTPALGEPVTLRSKDEAEALHKQIQLANCSNHKKRYPAYAYGSTPMECAECGQPL